MMRAPTTPELWKLGELLLIAALVGIVAMIGGRATSAVLGQAPLRGR
jgi:hypothetical protein